MEAQQIQDTDRGQRSSCEIRMLREHCSHEQATVTPTVQRELLSGRDPCLFEVLGDRHEVIENVLFARQPTGLVPDRAELSATSQIGDCEPTTGGQPAGPTRSIVREYRDLEPAAAVEHGWLRPGPVGISWRDQEVRHRGPVLSFCRATLYPGLWDGDGVRGRLHESLEGGHGDRAGR